MFNKSYNIMLVLLLIASCQPPQQKSKSLHLEGEFASSMPSYLWQAVPESSLEKYLSTKSNFSGSSIKAEDIIDLNSPLTKRLQEIANHLDSIARLHNPLGMKDIPPPIVAAFKDEISNAMSMGIRVCIKKTPTQNSESDTPKVETNSKNTKVFELVTPGRMNISINSPSNNPCELFVGEDTSPWDLSLLVEAYNSKLPADKHECRLNVKENNLILPSNEACIAVNTDSNDFIKEVVMFPVQTNVITFSTAFFENNSEPSVVLTMAHELAHYYRCHGTKKLLGFEPYFFLQTQENELKRPIKTTKYLDVQQALLERARLKNQPLHGIQNYKFDPHLFDVLLFTAMEVSGYCINNLEDLPCTEVAKEFRKFYAESRYYELIYSKTPTQDATRMYLELENIISRLFALSSPAGFDESFKERLASNTNSKIDQKYFSNINDARTLLEWFESANLKLVNNIKKLDSALEKAIEHGLGYYTSEEEADEIGLELAARAGINKQQMINAWLERMSESDANLESESFQFPKISKENCLLARENNWKFSYLDQEYFLLGDLNNHHHSNCYRLFNNEREWNAHDMDRFIPSSNGIVLDEKAWKEALESSL